MNDILTKEGLLKELTEIKTALEISLKDSTKEEISVKIQEAKDAFDQQIADLGGKAGTKEELQQIKDDMAEIARKNQVTIEAFDLLQTRMKGKPFGQPRLIKTLGEAIGDELLKVGKLDGEGSYKSDVIEQALSSAGGSFRMKLGSVALKAQGADMTLANSLTGDPVATYNQRQAIIPAQKVNFRDLIPTVVSPTGLYVTYSEDIGGTNNIIKQTEGALKGQNEYDLTEVKTVTSYLAGFVVITKQLLKFLPFMQNTLTRMLLRDFYKAENAQFFTTASTAATGGTSGGTSPDDVIQLINVIGAQLDTDYNVSYIVVSNATMARLIGGTYSKGYYPGAGSVVLNDARGITLFGVPVVAASWMPANYALGIDNDYIERVETEGLNVTFSFEDSDNFRRNKVTVKVECMEELNVMRANALIYMNLGAS